MTEVRKSGIFYGWWIVLACLVMIAYGEGAYYYGFGVFVRPIISEFGWARAVVAGVFSLAAIPGAITGPIFGPLVDRFGPRRFMLIGLTVAGLGFVAMGFINSLLMLYLVWVLLIATGMQVGLYVPASAAVTNWFQKKRATALGIYTLGFGAGGAIMTPVLGWLIGNYGWRLSAYILGAAAFVICLPLALIVRHKPEQYGYLPDGETTVTSQAEDATGKRETPDASSTPTGETRPAEVDFTVRQAIRTKAWWMIAFVNALDHMVVASFMVHLIPFITDTGIAPQIAANIVGLMALMSLPARLLFGYLGDRVPKRFMLATTLALRGIAIVILMASKSMWQFYLFALVFGFGYGLAPLMHAIRGEYFGRKKFATILGYSTPIAVLGSVSGPLFAGGVFDVTASYQLAFTLLVVICVIGAVIIWFAKKPKLPEGTVPVAAS